MFILFSGQRDYLLNLLEGNFDSISDYFSNANRFDLIRLLTNNSPLFILRCWDCYIDLNELGHIEGKPIIFLNTDFKEIKRFSYHPIFGELDEHLQWLLDSPNGQQVYIKIELVNEVQSLLCLIVNKVPLSIQKNIISNWVDQISWSVNNYSIGEVLLSYPGEHKLIIYRLSSQFNYNITKEDIINNPSTEIIELVATNVITFYKFQVGYYLFKEILPNNQERWLKITNLRGDLASQFRYFNQINYLGYTRTIQISLNIQDNPEVNKVIKPNDFRLMGDLEVASVDPVIIIPPAKIIVSPSALNYNLTIPSNSLQPQVITLTNIGGLTAQITDITLAPSNIATPIADWTGLGGSPITTITPGASKSFTLAYNPIAYGTFSDLDGIKILYKDNQEEICQTSVTVDSASISNFDYAVITYMWDESGGRDLDTRTSLVNTETSFDNVYVGWSRTGTSTDNSVAIVAPPTTIIENGTPTGPYYLFWGGDNTQTGGESVLIDFLQISTDMPSLEEIELELRAFWYSIKNSGTFSIQFKTYLGGTMQKDNYTFINVGGVEVSNFNIQFNSQLQVSEDVLGDCFKHLVYTPAIKEARFIDCPNIIL